MEVGQLGLNGQRRRRRAVKVLLHRDRELVLNQHLSTMASRA